ncbi:thiol-disulfide oxidoreductase DCC family protein [Virgibacillus siamensis]|uniref:thiol-disulfide oxidoreductase DCC family protein n=1 Tax=Virgibacillus siamensis TaxID=480071 RepID=UPI00098614C6|nr:DUF393 domain-containing protein [Virgibacillus siamensis]
MIIFYDSFCKLCTQTSKVWKKFDWQNQLTFNSFRSLDDYPAAMEEYLHVLHKGIWYQGFDAVLQISKVLPVLWLALPVLYIGKWLGLGDLIYDKVAANRNIIPINQCKEDGCRIDS